MVVMLMCRSSVINSGMESKKEATERSFLEQGG